LRLTDNRTDVEATAALLDAEASRGPSVTDLQP